MNVSWKAILVALGIGAVALSAEERCNPNIYLSVNANQSPGNQLAWLVTSQRKVGSGLPPLEFLTGAASQCQGSVPILAIQPGINGKAANRQTLMADAANGEDLLDVASDYRTRSEKLASGLEPSCRDKLEHFNLSQSPASGYGTVEYGLTLCLNAEVVLRRQSGRPEHSDGIWDLDDLLDEEAALESCLKLLCTAKK